MKLVIIGLLVLPALVAGLSLSRDASEETRAIPGMPPIPGGMAHLEASEREGEQQERSADESERSAVDEERSDAEESRSDNPETRDDHLEARKGDPEARVGKEEDRTEEGKSRADSESTRTGEEQAREDTDITRTANEEARADTEKARAGEPEERMEDLCALYGPEHTMCLPAVGSCGDKDIISEGFNPEQQQKMVDYSNKMRSKIANGEQAGLPSAANMRALKWNPDLAVTAQRWADQCSFSHDHNDARRDPGFKRVGQNIYLSFKSSESYSVPIKAAVDNWFNEVQVYKQQPGGPFTFDFKCGHFTQLAWAETTDVGCGFTLYHMDGMYDSEIVCNYGIGGNMDKEPMYKEGDPCSECQAGTSCTGDGLCD